MADEGLDASLSLSALLSCPGEVQGLYPHPSAAVGEGAGPALLPDTGSEGWGAEALSDFSIREIQAS